MNKQINAVVALVVALGISAANAIPTVPMPYPEAMAEFNAVYAYTNVGVTWIGTNKGELATMHTNNVIYGMKATSIPSGYTYAGVVTPIDLSKMFLKTDAYSVADSKTNDSWQFYAEYWDETNISEVVTNIVGTTTNIYPAVTNIVAKYSQKWTNLWYISAITSTYPVCSLFVDAPFSTVDNLIAATNAVIGDANSRDLVSTNRAWITALASDVAISNAFAPASSDCISTTITNVWPVGTKTNVYTFTKGKLTGVLVIP